jgi:hypothetical protein
LVWHFVYGKKILVGGAIRRAQQKSVVNAKRRGIAVVGVKQQIGMPDTKRNVFNFFIKDCFA